MKLNRLKPETIKRLKKQHEAQKVQQRQATHDALLEKYQSEPDREYAEAFWGSMLKEIGIYPA